MAFQHTATVTALMGLGLFCSTAKSIAQTAPSQPLKQPTPHYILGVPLPKFEVGGRLLKPTFRVFFPRAPKPFLPNKKDMLRSSVTGDGRVHPVISKDDFLYPPIQIDTIEQDHLKNYIPALNVG